ncbi:MAG TPA: LppX_LprAFG lipoprotein [Ktedonobacteraceae bacterium]|nr:LppX_LprAFG lipoprotein [Ktedonobacteraceae bacterium]
MNLSRISMRRALACALLCLAGGLLLVGCTPPWQHNNVIAASNFGAKPTAKQVLAMVQKNFHNVTAFHVVMKTYNLGTPTGDNQIQIRTAEGDVLMPDKVKAQANVLLSGQAVTINLISIGDTQYITDPITGQWRVVKGVLDASTLTNPDTGIISLANKLQNVTGPTADTVNGTPCWRVNGLLDAKYLAFLTGGGVPPGTMLKTSICAGKADALLYELKVTGQATTTDTPQTTRTFEISNYNENISINAPQIQ